MNTNKRIEEVMKRFRELSPEAQKKVLEKLKARFKLPKTIEYKMEHDGKKTFK